MSYSVLFREFPLDQLDATAAAVSEVYRITNYDARAKIRRGWGFLERQTTEETARQVVSGLEARGIGALAVEREQLRLPDDPKPIIGFTIEPSGFAPHFQSPQEPPQLVPWADVAIVAAGGFSEEVIRRETGANDPKTGSMLMGLGIFLVTGLPPGVFGGGKKKKEEKPVKSSRFITFGCVVTRHGEQFAFNIGEFDFTGLGARKQLTAVANHRALLVELARLSSARQNLGARLILENKSLSFANYQRLEDFETELVWMANCDG